MDKSTSHSRQVKRDKILSDLERERLINREKNDCPGINDARVRKKLSNWTNTFEDIALIFEKLPPEQLKDLLDDDDVYFFLAVAERIMSILDFRPLDGELDKPDDWKVRISPVRRWDDFSPVEKVVERPATEEDIKKTGTLNYLLDNIYKYYTPKNPVSKALCYTHINGFYKRLPESERTGVDRVLKAFKIDLPK